jgi:hypothetical protein
MNPNKYFNFREAFTLTLAVALLATAFFVLPQAEELQANISTVELNILDDIKPELTQKTADAQLLVKKDADTLTTDSAEFESAIPKDSKDALVLAIDPSTGSGLASSKEELSYFNHGTRAVNGRYSSNKIIYEDIWAHTDLMVTTLENGVKEDIILKNNQAPLQFEYLVETVGLRLELEPDGGYTFINNRGEKKFYTPAPDLTDAAGERVTAGIFYGLGWGEDIEEEIIEIPVEEEIVEIPEAPAETVEPEPATTDEVTEEVVEPEATETDADTTKVARPTADIVSNIETEEVDAVDSTETDSEEIASSQQAESRNDEVVDEVLTEEDAEVVEEIELTTDPEEEPPVSAEAETPPLSGGQSSEEAVEVVPIEETVETVEETPTEEVPEVEITEPTEEETPEEVIEPETEEVPVEDASVESEEEVPVSTEVDPEETIETEPTEEVDEPEIVEATEAEETPTEEVVEPVVETPAEEAPVEETPEPEKVAFFQRFLPKFLKADVLETTRKDFESSTQNYEQIRQSDGSILRRYKLQLTVSNVAGLSYPLDLDPSTFVQNTAEAAADVTVTTTIGADITTNDLTVNGTLTTAGSNLSMDDGLLYLDSDNGRVGIGTTEPIVGYKLDVTEAGGTGIRISDSTNTSSLRSQLADATGTITVAKDGIVSTALNFITQSSAGTLTKTLALKSGNVGIGTITPGNKLAVAPTQYSTGTASQSGTTVTGIGTTFTSAMVGSQLVYADGTNGGTITAFGSTTSLTVSTSQTVSAQAYDIAYTGLQVDSSGNVGIGTTAPTANLHVSESSMLGYNNPTDLTDGDVVVIGASSQAFPKTDGTSNNWSTSGAFWAMPMIYRSARIPDNGTGTFPDNQYGELILQGTSHGGSYNKGISFVTWDGTGSDPAIRMRIQGDGKVGIGTTTPASSFEVQGTGITLGGVTRTTWPTSSGTGAFTDGGTLAYYMGGNVGIGTTEPGGNLDIIDNQDDITQMFLRNSDTGTSAHTRLYFVTDSGGAIFGIAGSNNSNTTLANRAYLYGDSLSEGLSFLATKSSGDIKFYTAGNTSGYERMIIDNSGDVGIGTTAPEEILHIAGDGSNYVRPILEAVHDNYLGPRWDFKKARGALGAKTSTAAGDWLGRVNFQNYNGTSYGGAGGMLMVASDNSGRGGNLQFSTSPSGSSSSATRMVVMNDGKVGIGTLAPGNKLAVTPTQYSTGTASQSGTTVTGIGTTFTSAMVGSQLVYTDGTNGGTITVFGSTTSLTVSTSQTVSAQAYDIAYTGLQVDSNGKVGIGTTAPAYTLDVSGTVNATAFSIGTTTVTSTAAELNILDGVTSTAAELNILDGVTSTAAELNYVDGVTSAIQTQLGAKEGTLTNSAGLLAALSDETGTGLAVFGTTPTLTTPVLGVATGTSLDFGGTTLLASRALTVDTGGVFDINMGTASGDDFTIDTSAFVVEGDNGNVGIGTATPSVKLEISSEALGDDVAGPSLRIGRNTTNGSVGPAPGTLDILDANGTSRYLWVRSNGNVHVHTAAPTGAEGATVDESAGTVVGSQTSWYKLKTDIQLLSENERLQALNAILDSDIYNYKIGEQDYVGYVIYDENRGDWFSTNDENDQSTPALNERNLFGYQTLAIQELNYSIGSREQVISLAEAPTSLPSVTINSSGNVGIGTTAPTAALEVDGGGVFKKVSADPCGTGYPEGVLFYNDTSDYYCFCDGAGVDKKVSDNGACF